MKRNMKLDGKRYLVLFSIMLGILGLATLFSVGLRALSVRPEVFLLVYVVALIIIIVELKEVIFSAASVVVILFLYNFLFVEPQYTFTFRDASTWVTVLLFVAVEILMITLTQRMRKLKHGAISVDGRMNKLSGYLLGLGAAVDLAAYTDATLSALLSRQILLLDAEGNVAVNEKQGSFVHPASIEHEVEWCVKNACVCGYKESRFGDLSVKLFPIVKKNEVIGVLAVDCVFGDLSKEERADITTILAAYAAAKSKTEVKS